MKTEIFKEVLGYETFYIISNYGSIYSIRSNKLLKHKVHVQGYHQIFLSNNGKSKGYLIHRLVAIAFLSNPESKEQVNHIDGVKSNNSLSNLEWCTASENVTHSCRVLGNNIRGVIQLDKLSNELARFSSIKGASIETRIDSSDITNACKGKLRGAGGFRWKYA